MNAEWLESLKWLMPRTRGVSVNENRSCPSTGPKEKEGLAVEEGGFLPGHGGEARNRTSH